MKRKNTSVTLSLIACWIAAAVLTALIFCAPWLFGRYLERVRQLTSPDHAALLQRVFCLCFYPCAAAGAGALYSLIRLLGNIRRDSPFLRINVIYLRVISWCCIAAAVILLCGAYHYIPFAFAGLPAGFVGLMIAVVGNVMRAAVEIREDNDLTI